MPNAKSQHILITLLLCRSQKTSHLQKDIGLYLAQHGLSRSGQAAGPIIGDSVHRRTIDNARHKMAREHQILIDEQIRNAEKVGAS